MLVSENPPNAPPAPLPLPISDFVGRRDELLSLRQEFERGARLITLTGPGGVGKTRFALEYCSQAQAYFPGPVRFVSLQSLSDSSQVLYALAHALEVRETGGRSLLDDLIEELAPSPALLCIDNWEHVIDAAPQLSALLRACPQVRVLATSREALRLQGEREFRVDPLPVPAGDLSADALQLFAARAAAVRRDFRLDEGNAPTIAAICALLDGLPLAIELAAALMRLFSPQALLARLQSAPGLSARPPTLRLLAGGPRDLPARHQTLQATIAWSYDLLPPHEQRLFRRLSVFAGGCELEAAEVVCADKDAPVPLLDSLLALLDKNLLTVEQVDGEPRFAMLRTIQDFALEQLTAQGEGECQRVRHARYYDGFIERADAARHGPTQAAWMARLEREHDNLRALLAWSLETPERAEFAHDLIGKLWPFWLLRGHLSEARRWSEQVLATKGEVSALARCRALHGASTFLDYQGALDQAQAQLQEALALARRIGARRETRQCLNALGTNALIRGRYESARDYFEQTLALDRELNDTWGVAKRLNALATIAMYLGEFDRAIERSQESLAMMQALGDQTEIAEVTQTLGEIALRQGNLPEARARFRAARAVFGELRDPLAVAWTERNLGQVALTEGNHVEAEGYLTSALRAGQPLGDKQAIAETVEALACLAAARRNPEHALRLWSGAAALRDTIGAQLPDETRWGYDPFIRPAIVRLRERQALAATQQGAHLSLTELIHLALEPATPPTGGKTGAAGLSAREVEVLRLVSQGLTDAEVADQLVLSPRTVNAHLTSIYNKLGVNSRAAATRFAVENQLL
jgi:predicted ATPase/DNA-binding CsgD family transcriptional regulator/Tfp pilus assembly protein PilF